MLLVGTISINVVSAIAVTTTLSLCAGCVRSRRRIPIGMPGRSRQFGDRTLEDVWLTHDPGVIDGVEATSPEFFARVGVTGNNAIQLGRSSAQVIANQFAEDGTVVEGPLQVAFADTEHRAALTDHPRNGVVRVTTEDAAFNPATR